MKTNIINKKENMISAKLTSYTFSYPVPDEFAEECSDDAGYLASVFFHFIICQNPRSTPISLPVKICHFSP